MLIQGLGCGFRNEATITASIQMPLDLTFHARRELSFQVPANQMDGVPAIHTCPTSSGPAWVGPFSSPQRAIRPAEKLFKLEHSGLASPHCSSPRLHTQPLVIPTVVEGSLLSSFHLGTPTRSGHPGASAQNGPPVVHCAYGCQEENQKETHQENCGQEGEADQEGAQGETGDEEDRLEKGRSENEDRRQEESRRENRARSR